MDLSTVRDFKFFVCLPRQQRDTMNFQAFNLKDNSELIGLVDEFRHGTAYTSFDRSTFSYRYNSEGRIITKQKPKSGKKISPKTNELHLKKNTGQMVRSSEEVYSIFQSEEVKEIHHFHHPVLSIRSLR